MDSVEASDVPQFASFFSTERTSINDAVIWWQQIKRTPSIRLVNSRLNELVSSRLINKEPR